MDWLIHSFHHHQVLWTLGTYYFVASAVGSLPTPIATTGFYRFFFDFAHVFSANIFRVINTRIPQAQQFQGIEVTHTEAVTVQPVVAKVEAAKP